MKMFKTLILALSFVFYAGVSEASSRIAVMGDSLSDGVWMYLSKEKNSEYQFQRLGKISSGLVKDKYYDWIKKSEEISGEDYDAAVVMLGMNDQQTISTEKRYHFGTEGWKQEYSNRVSQVVKSFTDKGKKVIWIGLPPIQDKELNDGVILINSIVKEAVEASNGVYLSIYEDFTVDGKYSDYLSYNGKKTLMRHEDGKHLSGTGYGMVSSKVIDAMKNL